MVKLSRVPTLIGQETVADKLLYIEVSDVSKISEKTILIDEDGVEWEEIDIWHVSIK